MTAVAHPAAQHTDWCAGGHRCGLGEHRARPFTITSPAGCVVLTRVRANCVDHVEVRILLALPGGERAARRRLAGVLADLRRLIMQRDYRQ